MRKIFDSAKKIILQTDEFFYGKANFDYSFQKIDRETITSLDVKIEEYLKDKLSILTPHAAFWGEEKGMPSGESEELWVIDPIDSTNNFILEIPFFSVSVAYCINRVPTIGICFFPKLKTLLFAIKGEGAYRNADRIKVSSKQKLSDSLLLYDNQFYKSELVFENLKKVVNSFFTVRISGCASFDICAIACGQAEVRIFNQTKVMDFIPGGLILEEAGGIVSDFHGKSPAFDQQQIICSNGFLHADIIDCLNGVPR
ncbi:MAG: inositol monophosphatase [Oligoflexia bacterium]|nr:inositol monophosphatase [Oligoflexia bacterium]